MGTPAYMSPEQAGGRIDQLGPASDVYGLGATLYAVLTGRPPVGGSSMIETLRKAELGEVPPPRQVNPAVPAALEAVCLKALAHDPKQRYPSALDLAADVEHWLADEPVSAHRERLSVRAGRWARRHRPLVSGLAAAVAVALGSLAVATAFLARANRSETQARELAQRHAEEARDNFQLARQAVDDYSLKVSENRRLKESSPSLRKELLEAAVPFYERLLARGGDDPAMREELARASVKLASITQAIDNPKKSIPHYEKALTLLEALAAEFPTQAGYQAQLARTNLALGRLHLQTGDNAVAEKAFLAAVELQRRLAGEEPGHAERQSDLGAGLQALGNFYLATGKVAEAEGHFREAIDLFRRLLEHYPDVDDHRLSLSKIYRNLGVLYGGARSRTKEQEGMYLESLTLCKALAERHPNDQTYQEELASILGNLGILYGNTNRLAEGEKAYLDALAVKRSLAEKHPELTFYQKSLVNTMDDLGTIYFKIGRLDESEKIHRETVPLLQRVADRYPEMLDYTVDLAGAYGNLGSVLRKRDKDTEALEWFDRSIRTLEAVIRKQAKHALAREFLSIAHEGRALALKKLNRHAEAVTALDGALKYEDGPYRSTLRAERARTNARAGNLTVARAEADELLAQPSTLRPNDFIILGYMHVIIAAKVAKDASLAVSDRERRVEEHHSRAVSLFKQAREAKYFDNTKDRKEFLTDQELAPLRSRSDFQDLVRGLEAIK
jgi:tetratricopeptide (TPR) repeat protein